MNWRDRVIENENGCLIWQGRIDINGYARWGCGWAHRRVYEIERGPIPDRHELDHVCETPACVNPEHLDAVTRSEHCARTMRRLGKDDLHLSAAYLRTLGMTFAEVAEALGYSGREGAAGAVKAAIAKGLVDPDSVPVSETLSDRDREDIQALRAVGVPVREIAKWYGIHESQASRVSRGIRSGRTAA